MNNILVIETDESSGTSYWRFFASLEDIPSLPFRTAVEAALTSIFGFTVSADFEITPSEIVSAEFYFGLLPESRLPFTVEHIVNHIVK